MIVIDESGDLTIQVIEYEDGLKDIDSGDDGVYKTVNTNNQKPVIRHREEFRVCKNILTENSPVFKRLLTGWGFAEAEKDSITLKEDRVFAMGIWFRHMHGASVGDTKDVSLREMWHLTAAADKYDLCILDLKEWFADWYDRKPIINDDDGDNKKLLEARQLLYPCYRFNHARGFAIATKYLAYNSTGHITESNPTNHKELHLPSRMIRKQLLPSARQRFIWLSILQSRSTRPKAGFEPSSTASSLHQMSACSRQTALVRRQHCSATKKLCMQYTSGPWSVLSSDPQWQKSWTDSKNLIISHREKRACVIAKRITTQWRMSPRRRPENILTVYAWTVWPTPRRRTTTRTTGATTTFTRTKSSVDAALSTSSQRGIFPSWAVKRNAITSGGESSRVSWNDFLERILDSC